MSANCDWDPAQLYTAQRRKAAKNHRCDECHGTIRKGESHEYAKGLWEGQWSSFRTCPDCIPIRCELARLPGSCGGWAHGAMLEDMEDMKYQPEGRRIVAAYNVSVAHRGGLLITSIGDEDKS